MAQAGPETQIDPRLLYLKMRPLQAGYRRTISRRHYTMGAGLPLGYRFDPALCDGCHQCHCPSSTSSSPHGSTGSSRTDPGKGDLVPEGSSQAGPAPCRGPVPDFVTTFLEYRESKPESENKSNKPSPRPPEFVPSKGQKPRLRRRCSRTTRWWTMPARNWR